MQVIELKNTTEMYKIHLGKNGGASDASLIFTDCVLDSSFLKVDLYRSDNDFWSIRNMLNSRYSYTIRGGIDESILTLKELNALESGAIAKRLINMENFKPELYYSPLTERVAKKYGKELLAHPKDALKEDYIWKNKAILMDFFSGVLELIPDIQAVVTDYAMLEVGECFTKTKLFFKPAYDLSIAICLVYVRPDISLTLMGMDGEEYHICRKIMGNKNQDSTLEGGG